jgi:hypothetical protein
VRRYLYLLAALASVPVLVVSGVAAAAPAASVHVLTLGKPGGPNVKLGTVLLTHAVKGGAVVFTAGSVTVTCTSASITSTVVKNPVAPGTAVESVTAVSVGKCTASVAGVTVKSMKALNLPYGSSLSSAKGFPIVVTGQSTAKPIEVTSVLAGPTGTVTCTYQAAAIDGNFSNAGNFVTIKDQPLTLVSGSSGCSHSAGISARRLTKRMKQGSIGVCANPGVDDVRLPGMRQRAARS